MNNNDVDQFPGCKVGEKAAWKAATVLRELGNKCKSTKLSIQARKLTQVPVFDRSEMVLGDLLGKGGFNSVYSIHEVELDAQIQSQLKHEDSEVRLSSDVVSNPSQYAIKFLSEEIVLDDEEYIRGACDLALEAALLSQLSHPNIIRMEGLSVAGTRGFNERIEGSFFMVLEKMSCTLEDRLIKWRERGQPVIFAKRLHIATRISSALAYLHDNGVCHRDLKPDNIAFDLKGQVKLIDLGLSTVIDERKRCPHTDFFRLTSQTGAKKYMSPENYLGMMYGLPNDVFSFGMVLFEVLSASFAFEGMSVDDHLFYVVKGNYRPNIPNSWPENLQKCIRNAWSENPYLRPRMKQVHRLLKHELQVKLKENHLAHGRISRNHHRMMQARDIQDEPLDLTLLTATVMA
jgi:serine/threonine protein kinase